MERPTVQLCRTSPAKEFPPAISLRLAIALSKDPRGIRVTGLRSRILSQLSNTDSVSPVGVCLEWQVRRALQGFWRRRFNFRPVAVFNAVQSTHPAEVRSNLTVVGRSRARGPDPPDNGEGLKASRRRPAEPAGPATGLGRLELGDQESSRGGAIRQGRRSLDDPVLRPLLRAVPDILKARRRNARKVRKAFATSRNRSNQRRASHSRWPS